MKKITFIVVLGLISYLCIFNKPIILKSINNSESEENDKKAITNIENKEYYSGINNNLLFFNLAFGMNRHEVENKFYLLEKEKVFSNIEKQYGVIGASYTMNYHEYSNFGRVYCFFNNNKLNEIQIDTLNQNNNLLDLFIKKYGDADYLAQNNYKTEYHWIKGNQHLTIIQIENSNKLLIQYIDTTEKVKERNENILDKLGVYYKA